MTDILSRPRSLPALQQPDWKDHSRPAEVRRDLGRMPALVGAEAVRRLRSLLAEAAAGHLRMVQAGDCAEDPAEANAVDVRRKTALLDILAGTTKLASGRPALRVGGIAGQYAKPRSKPIETVRRSELPLYRGHMVNRPEPGRDRRQAAPAQPLTGYRAAGDTMRYLGWRGTGGRPELDVPVWTSHGPLPLDYEPPVLRREPDGSLLPASTHRPWVGERTRRLGGAHVALPAAVSNRVSVKVGPSMTPDGLLALRDRLDAQRRPGRLTLISRMGAENAATKPPALVEAVGRAGPPVLWPSDPVHGSTVSGPGGLRTRLLTTIVKEIEAFQDANGAGGGGAAGLHPETTPETTPESVTECVADTDGLGSLGDRYLSFCDPRLDPQRAVAAVAAWRG